MDKCLNLSELKESIHRSNKILLSTHLLPDGDGLGSEMALYYALKKLGKKVFVVNASPTPKKFKFLDPEGVIQLFTKKFSLPQVDLVIVSDTNDSKMLGAMEKAIQELSAELYFIDHHEPEENPVGKVILDPSFQSTGELVYRVLKELSLPIDKTIAMPIYAAMFTEAMAFRYRGASANYHRIISQLLETGLDSQQIYRGIFGSDTLSKSRFLGEVLSKTSATSDGKVVWIVVKEKNRKNKGATIEDTESFINHLTVLAGVEIAVLFREEPDGKIKVSLRGLGRVPVIPLAKQLGGGGHLYAAGVRLSGSLPKVVKTVIDASKKLIRQYR